MGLVPGVAFWAAIDSLGRLAPCRTYSAVPESSAAVDSIRLEVPDIYGKDGGQRLPFGEVHQRRVRKIHGAIPMPRHQRMDLREFAVLHRKQQHGAGAQEFPRGFHFPAAVAH